MRLGTALLSGRQAVVVAGPDESVHDVSDRVGTDLAAALADGRAAELDERALGAEVASEQLEWLPPIPRPDASSAPA